jgi:Holliday junction resolvase RusA-like endonuclease
VIETFRVVLPQPPSTNRYWRMMRGHIRKSTEAREYQELAAELARLQLGDMVPTGQPIVLRIWWYRQIRSGDLSNRIKVVEDALQGILYYDDKQVVELHAYRIDGDKPARIIVEMSVTA